MSLKKKQSSVFIGGGGGGKDSRTCFSFNTLLRGPKPSALVQCFGNALMLLNDHPLSPYQVTIFNSTLI